MSLKKRLLMVTCLLVLIASLVAWLALQRVSVGIIGQWGDHLVEAQVRHEIARVDQVLDHQTTLVRQAASALLAGELPSEWDPWQRMRPHPQWEGGLSSQLEAQSYWVALPKTEALYYRAANAPAHEPLERRVLDLKQKPDAYLNQQFLEEQPVQQKVFRTTPTEAPQLWTSVLLHEGSSVSGVLALGSSLNEWLPTEASKKEGDPALLNLFVDHQTGFIQLHYSTGKVALQGLAGNLQGASLDLVVENPWDRQQILELQQQLVASSSARDVILSRHISVRGHRCLLGIAYIPELGWYHMALLDLDELMPLNRMVPVVVVFFLALILTLLLLHAILCHLLLNPLAVLERAMAQVRTDKTPPDEGVNASSEGDVGRLIQRFSSIAATIQKANQAELRTEALEQLIRVDPLTGLLNRRGMTERLESEAERARRLGHQFAVLWIDVDRFKEINDTFGHMRGDQALEAVASVLRQSLRRYDYASRWGGDEFLVLLAPTNLPALTRIGERIRSLVEQSSGFDRHLTVSIGAYLAKSGESMEAALQCADEALYAAKEAGRNTLCHYSSLSHTS